jgi:glycosyltransferase involved in cell wall biosynthesis
MNIALDAYSAFNSGGENGMYARNVIRSLTHHFKDDHYLLFNLNKGKYPIQDFSGKEAHVEVLRPSGRFNNLFPGYFRSIGLGKDVSQFKADVFHGISNYMPMAFPPEVKATRILSVINTEKLRFGNENNFLKTYSQRFVAWRNFSRSTHFIVNSDDDRLFLQEKFRIRDSRMHVIHPALHPQFFTDDALKPDTSQAFHYLPKSFILCTASLRNSKRAEALIQAAYLDRNNAGLPVIFAAKSHRGADSARNMVKKLNIEKKVYFVDGVSTGMMLYLYRKASLVLHPSRYADNALPLLEAMACNIPVIASDLPVFRQNCGNTIHYLEDESPEGIQKYIEHFRQQPSYFLSKTPEALALSQTFTPAKFAVQLMQAYLDSK